MSVVPLCRTCKLVCLHCNPIAAGPDASEEGESSLDLANFLKKKKKKKGHAPAPAPGPSHHKHGKNNTSPSPVPAPAPGPSGHKHKKNSTASPGVGTHAITEPSTEVFFSEHESPQG